MNPVMIDLGFFQVRWYSFFILLGCVSAYIISILRVKKLKVTKTELTDFEVKSNVDLNNIFENFCIGK